MAKKLRIAIVDDHPVVRRGIRETLSEDGSFDICAEGSSAKEAINIASKHVPDLMLVDVNMPGGGIEAVKVITREAPSCKVVMLTIHEDQATVRAAMQAGACGYVAKGVDGEQLIETLQKVQAGTKYIDPALAAQLLSAPEAETRSTSSATPTVDRQLFNERELQILALLSRGLNNEEIAEQLALRENTIKHYMTPLFKKLGVRNRTEAALKSRSISPE